MDCLGNTKICKNCDYHVAVYSNFYRWEDKCSRLQRKECDLAYGIYTYGHLLNCKSERQISKDFWERIFGERKNKCCKEGKYWKEKR